MIKVYNVKTEDLTSKPNNYYIGRGSILGNPFTFDGKKSKLAKLSFKTREEALDAYSLYFDEMMKESQEFKRIIDEIYEKYKNGEDVYLQCFCKPLKCHGDIIASKLQQRLIKENLIKKAHK